MAVNTFLIPLNDWAAGERKFHSLANLEFFQTFENAEILDACVNVDAAVNKEGGRKASVTLHLEGNVTVACDRCLENLVLPLDVNQVLSVPEDFSGKDFSEDGKLDLSQAVYDFVCLSLPMKKVHPEGECNPDTLRFLRTDEPKDEEAASNSPFAALKGLFEENKH